jgi:hypothetical protein
LINALPFSTQHRLELATWVLKANEKSFLICGVYAPPRHSKKHLITQLKSVVQYSKDTDMQLVIMGDFNIDVARPENSKFMEAMQDLNMNLSQTGHKAPLETRPHLEQCTASH